MPVEIPEFKRCCCCLPLRYGLLAWAYVKMVVMILLCIPLIYLLIMYVFLFASFGVSSILLPIIMLCIALVFIILDTSFTIVFLVGGHEKNAMLMKIFYIYNIAVLCILTLIFVTSTLFELFEVVEQYDTKYRYYIITWVHTKIIGLVTIAIEAYFILLIRSEIKKLTNNCKFRFENNAAEAECSMEVGTIGINEHVLDSCSNGTDDQINGIYDQNKSN